MPRRPGRTARRVPRPSRPQAKTPIPSPVFVDTSAWLALLHRRDQAHARALSAWQALARDRRSLKTTSLVVAETQALLARRVGMSASMAFLDQIAGPAGGVMLWVDEATWRAAVATWLRRDVPEPLSVTDAVSFRVMRREKMRDAFAFDQHFEQAGFRLI